MKKFFKRILVFALPILVLVIVLMAIPLDKNFAYHFIKGNCYNHGEWLYHRIFENQAPVDVAFIGSSRTLHAVNDELLENAIEEKTGEQRNIVNLGFCQQGRNFQYSMLKDLLKHKHPKLVVMEITEDEPRSTHQSYPYIADMNDILVAPCLNTYYWSDLFKAIVVRWEQLKFKLFFHENLKFGNRSKYGYSSLDRVVTEKEVEQNRNYWNKRILRDHSSRFGQFLDSYPFFFINKSLALLERENINYCFLFIPTSNTDIKGSVFDQFYREKGNCYYINPTEYNQREFWLDASHLNDKGSEKLLDQLTQMLTEELCLKPIPEGLPLDGNSDL